MKSVAPWISLLWLLAPVPLMAAERVWEINGIRLEHDQVERLALDMARRTVDAVQANVPGIDLDAQQVEAMTDIYRRVSMDVYAEVVDVVDRADLDDGAKEERVRELVLTGQRRSHELLRSVLLDPQMQAYTAWEQRQVDAYRSRRWDRRRRRARR